VPIGDGDQICIFLSADFPGICEQVDIERVAAFPDLLRRFDTLFQHGHKSAECLVVPGPEFPAEKFNAE